MVFSDSERAALVRMISDRKHVVRDHRHHDVELELSVLGGDGDARIVAHHLEADLVHHLRNRRIHLARHDRRTRLHRGKPNLVEPGARAGGHEAKVACDFTEVDGQRAKRAAEARCIAHALHQLDAIRPFADVEPGDGSQMLVP